MALKKQDSESLLTPFLPVQEVAGTEGIVWVHVPFSLSIPFSLSDLSQIEKCLGSFSSDPDTYLKEFKYLTQSYDLTWHDIYILLSSILPEEKERVQQASWAHAHEVHQTDDTNPIGSAAIPRDDPNWDYQAGHPGWTVHNHMVTCLIAGLQKAVNFDKFREITQRPGENPA